MLRTSVKGLLTYALALAMLTSFGVQRTAAQDIVIVTHGSNAINQAWDQDLADFISLIAADSASVNVSIVPAATSTTPTLEAADLVIIGRGANSGDFDANNERAAYNGVSTPMICESSFIMRNNRLRWINSTTIPDAAELAFTSVKINPFHQGRFQWSGIDNSSGAVTILNTPFPANNYFRRPAQYGTFTTNTFNNGLVIRPIQHDMADNSGLVIAYHDSVATPSLNPLLVTWNAGQTFYTGSTETAGGPRTYFQIRDDDNLTSYVTADPDIPTNTMDYVNYQGKQLYRNIINGYVPGFGGDASIIMLTHPTALVNKDWDQVAADFIESISNIPVAVTLAESTNNLVPPNPTADELNSADLVIIGRGANSSTFDSAAERDFYNGLTVPLHCESSFIVRSNRLRWFNSSTIPDASDTSFTTVEVVDAGSDAWIDIDTSGGDVKIIEDGPFANPVYYRRPIQYVTTSSRTFTDRLVIRPIQDDMDDNNGNLIATHSTVTTPSLYPLLVTWDTGQEFYDGAASTAGGPRVYFQIRDDDNLTSDVNVANPDIPYDTLALLNPDGVQLYKNVLALCLPGVPVEMSTFKIE
jgi:hypothetical protein